VDFNLKDAANLNAGFADGRMLHHRQRSERPDPDVRAAARVASIMIAQSRARLRLAPDVQFEDPQWMVLLDLFLAECRGVRVSVSSACSASGVPGATALRQINRLEERGMVERCPNPKDKRSTYLELTPRSREQVTRYLLSIAPDLLGPDYKR